MFYMMALAYFFNFSWDTSLGPIIFENFNRQIATKLPTPNIYGMGENKHEAFKHDLTYKNWPIFNRDEALENVITLSYLP